VGGTPQRLSLHIGINYPGTPYELHGCVNDALDWEQWAGEAGYATRALHDDSATRAAILGALEALVEQARRGDHVLITLSSHGTQVPDTNGDERDGYDEAFVPVDFRQAGVITDDELHELLGERHPGARFVVVADSCFSGTLQRVLDFAPDNGADAALQPADRRVRFLPPAAALVADPRGADLPDGDRPVMGALTAAKSITRGSVALLAGCSESESCYDASFHGRPNGAFTYVALQALRADPSAHLGDLFRTIRQTLPSGQYPQTPQLQATFTQRRWALRD
jgi:hypothetical protein